MSASKMLFVAEAAFFQPKGKSLGSLGKRKYFQVLSAVFTHIWVTEDGLCSKTPPSSPN